MKPVAHRAWAIAATIVVASAVAYGFWIVGSPESRRTERLTEKHDERRIDDLKAIVAETRELVYDADDKVMRRALFANLAALRVAARRRTISVADPVTESPYTYRVLDEHRYQLCAEFDGHRSERWDVMWNHEPGRRCWTIDVRDEP